MTRKKKVRMVVLVRPELLDKYRTLAAQYGVSRNDLCRYALKHGYQGTVTWCRRHHELLGHDDLAGALDFGPAEVIGRVQQVASRGPAGPLLRCAVSGSGDPAPGSDVDPLSASSVSDDDSGVVALEPGEWSDVYKVVIE